MAFVADRVAEQRQAKLQEIQRQIEAGSLTVCKITPEERKRYRHDPRNRAASDDVLSWSHREDGGDVRAAHDALCERSRIASGCPAKSRQIFKLDCRSDGRDCEIEVGKPLPSRSGVVVAVLDGREQVFAVYTDAGGGDVVRVGTQ